MGHCAEAIAALSEMKHPHFEQRSPTLCSHSLQVSTRVLTTGSLARSSPVRSAWVRADTTVVDMSLAMRVALG